MRMQSNKNLKKSSYKDLIQHFKQSNEGLVSPPLTERPPLLQLKKYKVNDKQNKNVKTQHSKKNIQNKYNFQYTNKQNRINREQSKKSLSNKHQQSLRDASPCTKSLWIEDDGLKQYGMKRKQKQLQLSYNKFIGYITNLLTTIIGIPPPQLLIQKMTYLQYLAILKQISFIRESYQPSPCDLVYYFWQDLISNGQTIGVFILFVASILNMKRNNQELSQNLLYISRKYSDFRYTRMELHGKSKTFQDQEQSFSFTPNISQKTRTLATSRSKDKYSRGKATKSCYQHIEQDSFNHQVHQVSHQNQKVSSTIGNKRSQILYKQAKQKSLQKRIDKPVVQIEYQKSKEQLTFHPCIHPVKKQKPKKPIQGQQNCINRIIRGRIQRQVKKIIADKGLPYNQKLFQKMKKQRYQAYILEHNIVYPSEEPQAKIQQVQTKIQEKNQKTQPKQNKQQPIVLDIEVDQNRRQKLKITDRQKYRQSAFQFIRDHNLKPEMYQKLVQGIQQALKFQLTCVQQDSCQSQTQSL